MKSHSFILLASDTGLRLLSRDGSGKPHEVILPASEDANIGDEVKAALRQAGHADEPLIIALDHHQCFAVPIEHNATTRFKDTQAMLFAAESQLPWAAEEIVGDFIRVSPVLSLAIVALADPIHRLVGSLEEAGLVVETISPATLLALQHLQAHKEFTQVDVLIWQAADCIHALGFQSHRLASWLVAFDETELQSLLAARSSGTHPPLKVGGLGMSDACRGVISDLPGVELIELNATADLNARLLDAADKVSAGELIPLINLRTGQLAPLDRFRQIRPSLNALCVTAIVFLIVTAAAMWFRSRQYDQMTAEAERGQRQTFTKLYPSQSVPLDVMGRLKSEHRRLAGLSGSNGEWTPPRSALSVLQSILASLPRDLRFRLLELRIENDKIFVEGEVNSHSDAETLAMSLKQSSRLTVEPPRTENKSANGVSFTIAASVPSGKEKRP